MQRHIKYSSINTQIFIALSFVLAAVFVSCVNSEIHYGAHYVTIAEPN